MIGTSKLITQSKVGYKYGYKRKLGLLKKSLLTAHKDIAKSAKLKACNSALCDLCAKPWRPLRLMDFDFFNSPNLNQLNFRIIITLPFLILNVKPLQIT